MKHLLQTQSHGKARLSDTSAIWLQCPGARNSMRKGEKAVNILTHTFKVLKYLINPDHNDYRAKHRRWGRTALVLRAPHRKVRREKHGTHFNSLPHLLAGRVRTCTHTAALSTTECRAYVRTREGWLGPLCHNKQGRRQESEPAPQGHPHFYYG